MRPAADPLNTFDVDGDGRGIPQLEPEDDTACRQRWRLLNAVELPSIRATIPSERLVD